MAALSSQDLRAALGQFATGVAVVATRDAEGRPLGLTINSFSSVSLTPPLVLWSLAHRSRLMPLFEQATHFAVSILAAPQLGLSEHFAHFQPADEQWRNVAWRPGMGGSPVLEGALAWFECRTSARHVEGDHTIFIGSVEACGRTENATAPLIFHGGRYYTEWPLEARK